MSSVSDIDVTRRYAGPSKQFQHHVPQLMLDNWCDKGGKLTRFWEPVHQKVVPSRSSKKKTGGEYNTYTASTLLRAAHDYEDFYENGVAKVAAAQMIEYHLSQTVDSQYTKEALNAATSSGKLSDLDQRDYLLALMMSFRARHPAILRSLLAFYRPQIQGYIDYVDGLFEGIDLTKPLDDHMLEDVTKALKKSFEGNDSVMRLNPHIFHALRIMQDKEMFERLQGLTFIIGETTRDRRFLLADIPVFQSNSEIFPFLFLMPLSPTHVAFLVEPGKVKFFQEYVSKTDMNELVNTAMAYQAIDSVYGVDDAELGLVQQFFGGRVKDVVARDQPLSWCPF